MIEKIIDLKDIELVNFLGIHNNNIQKIESAFPKAKIISRGNKISIKGNKVQLLEVEKIILSLIIHFNKFGKIDNKTISNLITNGSSNEEKEVIVFGFNGKKILAKTSNQKKIVTLIKANDLVFVIGPAGTGKTYVSVALALKALKDKSIKKIIVTKPIVEAGENLGFLPGDLQEKIDPYLRPIYDALQDMLPINKIKKYIENKTIEIAPIASDFLSNINSNDPGVIKLPLDLLKYDLIFAVVLVILSVAVSIITRTPWGPFPSKVCSI